MATEISTPKSRFMTNMDDLFAFLSDMIISFGNYPDLKKVCPVELGAVQLTKIFMNAYDPDNLVESFISIHQKWHLVKEEDPSFILEEMDKMLRDNEIVIDSRVIRFPFIIYNNLCNSADWKRRNQNDWPITKEDIDCMWDYFRTFVIIACNHIHVTRAPLPQDAGHFSYSRSYYDEVDIGRYSAMFGFQLI